MCNVVQPSPLSSSNIFITPKGHPVAIKQSLFIFHSSQFLETTNLLSISIDLPIFQTESYINSMQPFVTGLFHLAYHF